MRALTILAVACCFFAGSCNKNPFGCYDNNYSFEMPVKIYPDNETLAVGDTFWIEYSMPKQFTDLISGEKIFFDGAANLGLSINFQQLCPDSILERSVIPAVNAFQLHVTKGKFLPDDLSPNRNVDYSCFESNDLYQFQLAVVPKQKGLFVISPGDESGVYRNSAKCPKVGFQMKFKETNQHTQIYTDFWPFPPSQYELTHIYCFTVK